MKFPLSWLKEYVDIDITPQELGKKLTNIGFEIEEIIYLGKDIENVFIGKITKIERHPNADKLVVCTVDMGDKILTIVTGATNVHEGDVIPVAVDGAILPCGKNIKAAPLRGVTSQGMLCSGEELCIDNSVIDGAEVDGILILPPDAPLGMDIKTYLDLDDYVLDISITPNRADCQSIIGMCREISAVLGKPLKMPSTQYTEQTKDNIADTLKVKIEDYKLCPRYMASMVSDVKITQSPKLIKSRLYKAGIRAINNIVDITNYVLVETGQPMHAFDASKIKGNEINVRLAKAGESLLALDGKNYLPDSNTLVIADGKSPVALAGIMGGEESSVSESTMSIIFEAASFARGSVRASSKKLGLSSASSQRFIRGVDLGSPEFGMKRALALIDEFGYGKINKGIIDIKNKETAPTKISVSVSKINGLLGIEISGETMKDILDAISISTTLKGDTLECVIPVYREDLENDADIAEEIIRYYGYDNIVAILPPTPEEIIVGKNPFTQKADKTKNTLVGLGVYEAVTYSFLNKKSIESLNLPKDDYRLNTIAILNPLSEEFGVMRTTLVSSLLNVAKINFARNNNAFRFFELGRVYIAEDACKENLPEERNILGVLISGENEDFFTLKQLAQAILGDYGIEAEYIKSSEPYFHPGRSADIMYNNEKFGSMGQIHPIVALNNDIEKDIYVLELDFDKICAIKNIKKFKSLPKYPAIERDIAIIVEDKYTAAELTNFIKRSGGAILESVELFDVYSGKQIEEGHKSMAFSLVFRSTEKTLKDEEIAPNMNKIINGLSFKYNAKLRV